MDARTGPAEWKTLFSDGAVDLRIIVDDNRGYHHSYTLKVTIPQPNYDG